jgi:hypothetical protein
MPAASSVVSLVRLFTDRLAAVHVEYMVTGSVACIAYGEPRLTHDVDLVLELKGQAQAEAMETAFPLEDFYVPPIEVIRAEQARSMRGHFNVIHHDSGYKADVYLLRLDPLHQWAFPRRRTFALEGGHVVMAPPEYVILRKLEFFREGGSTKHLTDIAGVLRVSRELLDMPELLRLVGSRGLTEAWQKAQDEVDR